MRFVLATVCTDSYFPGTLVLLSSFLRHNPWFNGHVVVYHHRLKRESQELLKVLDTRIRLEVVGPRLREKVSAIVAVKTFLRGRAARFYSLAAFALRDYERLVFFDSDILITGDVSRFFQSKAEIAACGERISYTKMGRDYRTLLPTDSTNLSTSMFPTINAGAWSLKGSLLEDRLQERLFGWLGAARWNPVQVKLTDQVLMNWLFAELDSELLSSQYNFLIPYHREIGGIDQYRQASVLHFVAPGKPWSLSGAVHKEVGCALYQKAATLWREEYRKAVAHLHFASLREGLSPGARRIVNERIHQV